MRRRTPDFRRLVRARFPYSPFVRDETMAKPNVLVLGGGFGGLESAFYLRAKLGSRVNLTLLSDQDHFLYKPNTIYIPFGLDPEKLRIPLARPAHKRDIAFVQARAHEIDPNTKTVSASDGKHPYDYLIVATGSGMRAEEVPGLREHAHSIWTPEDMLRLRVALRELKAHAQKGRERRVVFLVPPNNKCSGPLYEIVLMLDTWLRKQKLRAPVHITWATCESGFIQAFGPRLHELVASEYERRGIIGLTDHVVKQVARSELSFTNGQRLPFDLLISFPPYIAATPFAGLPQDERGFLNTGLETRQVRQHPEIYAVGDAGDFPVKQAFLAFLQADAAADHLSSIVLGTRPQAAFDPISMCVMEQFDQATFAQVPLRLTGDPAHPVEVRPGMASSYRVGTGGLWRLGKQLLSVYLPWRFRAGNPFHAGLPWRGMELGLKIMSKVLAS
jgi:NADH dehydrogenase FAD-containing subunit